MLRSDIIKVSINIQEMLNSAACTVFIKTVKSRLEFVICIHVISKDVRTSIIKHLLSNTWHFSSMYIKEIIRKKSKSQ